MGGLTSVGGGVDRDVLLSPTLAILRTDFYATAALAVAVGLPVDLRRLRSRHPPDLHGLAGAGLGVAGVGLVLDRIGGFGEVLGGVRLALVGG
jgi:uncharacterized membrane protein YeiH